EHVEAAGGRIIKFMGDAGLAVFDEQSAEAVIFAMADFAKDARQTAVRLGLETYLSVNVHVGPALAGSFCPRGAERYDVIGKTVNIAARLGRRGLTLSPQAFRCLSDKGRKGFRKITQPITYRLRCQPAAAGSRNSGTR
ncbi:MAG: adenylate/guanylate cyclase domain-containing protein, partial [Planctomycetota bacterium]